MVYFYVRQNDRIISQRIQEVQEHHGGVALQLDTVESCNGAPGWRPVSDGEFFPVCPIVGDTFLMNAYYSKGAEANEDGCCNFGYKRWRVVSRSLILSGPSDVTTSGIVQLLVEVVDGLFPQANI